MKKIFKVVIEDTCESCPFCSSDDANYFTECEHPNHMVDIIAYNSEIKNGELPPIPETCPLESYVD